MLCLPTLSLHCRLREEGSQTKHLLRGKLNIIKSVDEASKRNGKETVARGTQG